MKPFFIFLHHTVNFTHKPSTKYGVAVPFRSYRFPWHIHALQIEVKISNFSLTSQLIFKVTFLFFNTVDDSLKNIFSFNIYYTVGSIGRKMFAIYFCRETNKFMELI